MRKKIVNKQNNGKMCIVCGNENDLSMHTRFYDLESGEMAAVFHTKDWHQSYPGRVHGGMAAAVLDELMGRAICIDEPGTWAVTADLNVKYKAPVPTDAKLTALARVTRNTRKIFEGEGEIYLGDGSIAVSAKGKYMKLDVNRIVDDEFLEKEWRLLEEDDPEYIEIKDVASK